ncbi:MAG: hypothetical protein WC817_01315 [Patescibacteria group bacterium]|jgi:hypothetical protein
MAGRRTIERAIEQTVAYFSLFQYPLTVSEIWRLLWSNEGQPTSLSEITFEIDENESLRTRLTLDDAFVQLAETPALRKLRESRYRVATVKMRRVKLAARAMSHLPWVQGVAVCNSLGYQNTRPESDIDFFIITQPNTLWLTRFIVTVVMKLLRQRPAREHTPNALCLSFFVTTSALNLSSLALPGSDPYLTYWLVQLTPLFGRGNIWERFWDANRWVQKSLPNVNGYGVSPHSFYRQRENRKQAGWLVRWCDQQLEKVQRNHFSKAIREGLSREGTAVVASRDVLKFHTDDRRETYRSDWQRLLQERMLT